VKRILVWFRRDLRLQDNPALCWALAQKAAVLPIYIHSPAEEAPWAPGAASRWWLHHSLLELERRLARRGLTLHCLQGNAGEILPVLVRDESVHALAVNGLCEPQLAMRDLSLFSRLADAGIETVTFDANLLFPPDALLNQQGKPYRVFTPFWRKARRLLETNALAPAPALPHGTPAGWTPSSGGGQVASLALLDPHPWHHKLHSHWQPGESHALHRLERFIDSGITDYRLQREYPAQPGSSRLSPHLHFGEISPRQIYQSLLGRIFESGAAEAASIECFLAELGWREFAHHVLWYFPQSSEHSLNPRFTEAFWVHDDAALTAWQTGCTGIPLIDAGMRELWETGWMHNRLRMLVGSFLTKNLGIHWLAGARWFWDTLVDADLANNTLGWQWIAGCGVDAAPYQRIFNPQTQATKFDPQQAYVRRWLGDRPYRPPLVDLAESRRQALNRYKKL